MEKAMNGKKTLGRRKIEIKKIEKKANLQVAFTKRRSGLFRKASELSLLCGAEVAILVQSPAQKLYAFGHPSVGSLISRVSSCDDGRIKYEAAMQMLEMEKRRAEEGGGFWWEQPIEGFELHQLEEFLTALEDFGDKVEERVAEFHKSPTPTPTLPFIQQITASSQNHQDQIHQILD